MAFRLSMLLDADASQAKAALGETRAAVDATKKSARDLGQEGRRAAQGVNTLSRAADGAEAQVRQLSAAEKQAAADALRLGRSGKMAAGSMGNLVAQFNDIGMMMMAGQNPLQLAVQQGTQITQVIGPMGAAGAVRALGSAFVSMLNPVNLITIGAIAAGAAFVNWLTRSKEDVRTLADEIEALQDAHEAYAASVKEARTPTVDLAARFGADADAAREYLRVVAEIRRREALLAAERARATFVGDTGIGDVLTRRQRRNQEIFGLDEIDRLTEARTGGPGALLSGLVNAYREIEAAADQSTSVQLEAWERLYETTNAAAAAVDGYSAEENERLLLIGQQIIRLRELQEIERQRQEMRGEADGPVFDPADVAAAEQLLQSLRQQAEMQAVIAQYGADSVQVAEARLDAERAAKVELIESLNVADAQKQELLDALEAVMAIERSNMAEAIKTASAEAADLARNLSISVAAAASLSNLQSSRQYSGRGGDPRAFSEGGKSADYENQLGYTPVDKIIESFNRRSSRTGSGASLDREREAVERLIEREREQLELLRATDPVQKELIRNREILASATDAERMQVEQLISARIEEREAMEMAQRQTEFWRDNIYDALEGAVFRSESLADVLNNVVGPALLKAAVLGEGPLGGLFGGQGLLGLVFPALQKADGGYITGSGGPREDKVPIMGSAGEFMVNAKATNRYRHLLEHINSGGDVPGYATGGLVGSMPAPTPLAAQTAADQRPAQVEILLAEGLRARILGDARQQTAVMIREFSRVQLPGRVEAITNDPGARG